MLKGLIKEFKDFAIKGNVIDLAVAVLIGAAFGKIVTSLVNDIVMPLIGILLGGRDFSSLSILIGDAEIRYGAFLQSIVDFSIIALAVFLFIRFLNKFKTTVDSIIKPETFADEPIVEIIEVETLDDKEEIKVLREIRDLLKDK
jgi:large conductance mechanosensitive channel